MKPRASALTLLGALIALAALVVVLDRPPAVLPVSAPAAEFSGERAMAHVFAVARQPHPLGSAEHDRVRDYIVAQVAGLGQKAEVQNAIGISPRYQAAGQVENIVTRVPGTAGRTDAILLMAHYDSVPSGPGAADNAAGISVLLETLRALRSMPPLQNDVIFLFSDGEEDALLGSAAFAGEHRWAKDVLLALNFDCRGLSGQAGTFETSPENGVLIRTLASAYPRAQSTSLYYEIYRRMPNDTDLTVFKHAGAAAMNFGFTRNWEFYHTRLDHPAALDPGSVQQLGGIALALVRRFGDADLHALRATDAVFFALPIVGLVHYPYTWGWPLVALASVVWLVAARRCLRSGKSRMLAVLAGVGVFLLSTLLLTACAFGIVSALGTAHGSWLPAGPVYTSVAYALGTVALLLLVWFSLFSLVRRWFGAESLILAAGLFLLISSAMLTQMVVGASYLVLWPALAIALASFALGGAEETSSSNRWVMLSLFSLPAVVILVSTSRSFFDALGLASQSAPALGMACALLLVAVTPAVEEVRRAGLRPSLTIFVGAALVFLVIGAAGTRYSEAHPEPSLVLYTLDADARKATWAIDDDRPNGWTSQLLGESPVRDRLPEFAYSRYTSGKFLQASAPVLPLQPAVATVVKDERLGETRHLTVRVQSPGGARAVFLLAPKDLVGAAMLGGKTLGTPGDAHHQPNQWLVLLYNPSAAGEEVEFRLTKNAPLQLTSLAYYPGMPAVPDTSFRARPPELMQQHGGDRSLVRKSFEF